MVERNLGCSNRVRFWKYVGVGMWVLAVGSVFIVQLRGALREQSPRPDKDTDMLVAMLSSSSESTSYPLMNQSSPGRPRRKVKRGFVPSQNASTSMAGRKIDDSAAMWAINKNGVPYPPWESLVQNGTVVGDVQFLVNFVIAGFSKCGTSSLSKWLDGHPQILVPNEERYDLIEKDPRKLVKRMYRLYSKMATPKGYIQGYKQPKDVSFPQTIQAWNRYWPKTKLIVTVRHPVHWFESFWNFFRLDLRKETPGVGDMIGRKVPRGVWEKGVHTGLGEFHLYLSRLGKTNQTTDPDEWALLKDFYLPNEIHMAPAPYVPHKVFFLETSQLADKNENRSVQLRQDLQEFLGLRLPFPPVVHVRPLKKNIDAAQKESLRMDICRPQHDALRAELMRIARAASAWIRRYFLESEDVVVSSREFLEQSLSAWMVDPCANTTTAATNGS
jgi:hypothetical protein